MSRPVDVVEVQAAQLADPDSGGVQQFQDQPVAQRQRIVSGGRGDQRGRLVVPQHPGQFAARLRAGELRAGVTVEQPVAMRPGGEGTGGCRAPGQRAARRSRRPQPSEPTAQHAEVEVVGTGAPHPARVVEQRDDVGHVCAHRVCRPTPLAGQVSGERVDRRTHRVGQRRVCRLGARAPTHEPERYRLRWRSRARAAYPPSRATT